MATAVQLPLGGLSGSHSVHPCPPRLRPPRLLVAWLPAFRLERCGWEARDKVALIAPEKNAMRVQALTPGASALGIRVGMGAAEARALVPDLAFEVFEERAPVDEGQDLHALSVLLRRLSPAVTPRVDHCDAIAVDVTDTLHLLGSEQAAVDRAMDILADVGHRCRVVVVDGDRAGAADAARALAMAHDQHRIVPFGGLADALAPLPISLMRTSLHLEDGLRAVGVRTLGELARLSPASVACRYGAEGLALLQLARADRVSRPPLLEPSEREACAGPSLRAQLPAPADRTDRVLPTLDRLLEGLCEALQTTECAAVRIQLRLVLEGAPDTLLSIRLGRPGRDPATVGPLLRRRLEDLQVSAPVVEVGLDVLESCTYHGHQHGLLDRSEALEPLPELLARLLDGLGEDSLFSARAADQHRPEAAWEPVPFALPRPGELFRRDTPAPIGTLPRPSLLLPDPRPLRVALDPAGDVAGLEVEGRWVRVDAAIGPERLCGEWWTLDPFERDYHRVALADGRMAWIFLDRETGDWWLHGWFG